VSPIQKIEATDLKSIKSITTRAYDLLSANSNMQKFTLCDWVISPDELALFSTFETNRAKMDQIFNIGYEAAKKSYSELIV
jgi:NTE family protein